MDTMHIIEPDFSIPIPDKPTPLTDFTEKVEAACRTIEEYDIEAVITEETAEEAEEAIYQMASSPDPDKINKQLAKQNHLPAYYVQARSILDAYSHKVVDHAMQLRLLVTNKLIIETENEDAKIRLRALELLGKITDVGLFTEKSEVTINHRSTVELVGSLRAKIQKLMYPDNVQEGEVVEQKDDNADGA